VTQSCGLCYQTIVHVELILGQVILAGNKHGHSCVRLQDNVKTLMGI